MTPAHGDGAIEEVPDSATEVFGDRLELAVRYAGLLCGEGVLRGLIGPREPARIWTRHLLNSAALAPFVPEGATVVDLGSGAGLPGIPLALARPDLRVSLLEPLARRMRFLELACEELGLPITLIQARAEAGPSGADVVVARAVAPLDRLLMLAVPLLRPGGVLLAQKGARAADELATASEQLSRLKPAGVSVHPLALEEEQTHVVRVVMGPGSLSSGARTPGSRSPRSQSPGHGAGRRMR